MTDKKTKKEEVKETWTPKNKEHLLAPKKVLFDELMTRWIKPKKGTKKDG